MVSILKPKDLKFLKVIENELSERRKRNSRYSIRAFALFLGIDHSYLAKALGKRGSFSDSKKSSCLRKLGFSDEQIRPYLTASKIKRKKYKITDEELEILSDWRNFAILELFLVNDFDQSHQYISRRLGINLNHVQAYLDRLVKCGFLGRENGKYELLVLESSWNDFKETTEARKKIQIALNELSLKSISEVPSDLRYHSTLTVALNKGRLDEFKIYLNEFKDKLAVLLQEQGPLDEVYQLNLSLFPLTTIAKV